MTVSAAARQQQQPNVIVIYPPRRPRTSYAAGAIEHRRGPARAARSPRGAGRAGALPAGVQGPQHLLRGRVLGGRRHDPLLHGGQHAQSGVGVAGRSRPDEAAQRRRARSEAAGAKSKRRAAHSHSIVPGRLVREVVEDPRDAVDLQNLRAHLSAAAPPVIGDRLRRHAVHRIDRAAARPNRARRPCRAESGSPGTARLRGRSRSRARAGARWRRRARSRSRRSGVSAQARTCDARAAAPRSRRRVTTRFTRGQAIDQLGGARVSRSESMASTGRVAARVALHADRVDRDDEPSAVCAERRVELRAEAADGEAGAGEGMAVEQLGGQVQARGRPRALRPCRTT